MTFPLGLITGIAIGLLLAKHLATPPTIRDTNLTIPIEWEAQKWQAE